MATAEEWLRGEGDPPPVLIRSAAPEDVDAVAAIEASSFSNPWHPKTFRSLVAEGRVRALVAEDPAGEIVGYAVVWWVLDQGELANLAVMERYRGMGVGSALLDRVLADARAGEVESLFLEVRMSNEPAQALYLSRGFAQVAVRKDYYKNPREDARVLLKRLMD